jgi:tetratricopeptide (TPR) repeat protein
MFGFGWLALRQVQEALNDGRLEEAQRLLEQPSVRGHRRHGELLRQLARMYVERAERTLRQDNAEGAWQDLLRAEQLQTAERGPERLRQALTRLGVAQVRALLQTGDPKRASQVIGQLRDHLVRNAELQLLEETTKNWLTAQELAELGNFAQAIQTVDRIQRLQLGPSTTLEQFRQSLLDRQRDFGDRLIRLHAAADAGHWREVLELAERVLAVAPQHPEARKARSRAWRAIEPVTVAMRPPVEATVSPTSTINGEGSPSRFYLWIDGVGGYLVCLSPHVTLGQSCPDTRVDVPMVADVSRLHASVTRDSDGGYLLEAPRPVQVNGQAVTRWVMRPGDRLTLGPSCQLQFQRPVAVSVSARLDFASGHRSLPGVDGVLLMADTLVLGPDEQSHVRMTDLKHPLVLFRTKEGLGVRFPGPFLVDGERVKDRAVLNPTAHVSGEDFSLALEPAGKS